MSEIEAALAAARADYTRILRDRADVRRKTGETFDAGTGSYTATHTTVASSAACRIKPLSPLAGSEVQAGEREVVLRKYELTLAHETASEIDIDDEVIPISSDDTWVVGRPLAVITVEYGSDRAARRLIVEDRE